MNSSIYTTSKLAQEYRSGNRQAVKDRAIKVLERARSLKPGARRLLLKLHRLLEQREFKSVSRSEIAALLEHPKMHRYDLMMMDELIKAGFVRAEYIALPMGRNKMPRGAAYHYSMSVEVGWMLSKLRRD